MDKCAQVWTPQWLPVALLDRSKDDTYLVRVESALGTGQGWIDKGYYADDEDKWYESNANGSIPLERGPWKVTAFAPWPDIGDIEVSHTSDCAVHNEPAMPNGPCNCGAKLMGGKGG